MSSILSRAAVRQAVLVQNFARSASALLPQLSCTPSTSAAPSVGHARAGFHTCTVVSKKYQDTVDATEGADAGEEAPKRRGDREGRPFLDPRAPRIQPSIRADPIHKGYAGLIDILEHNAYCDGQREEDPDGWFFDGTKAEYDSDCDGDPFANGYLTEDELEFSEDYTPAPYVPGRIVDQIYFLYSVRGYSIKALCSKYRLSSEKISAIINLKFTEPEMVASGRFTTKVDKVLQQLYDDKFLNPDGSSPHENWKPDFDQGVNYNILQDDQIPDDVVPKKREVGNVLRLGHYLPKVAPPKKAERVHDSKFVFLGVSGRRNNKTRGRPMIVSDFNGDLRPASNRESLYRSWETRHWTVDAVKGKAGMPFADEDADKPAKYYLAP
jgi:hypothetical protein